MNFIRPEVRAFLWRWREGLAGGCVAARGLYWILASYGLLSGLGWLVLLAGLALAFAGCSGRDSPPGAAGRGWSA